MLGVIEEIRRNGVVRMTERDDIRQKNDLLAGSYNCIKFNVLNNKKKGLKNTGIKAVSLPHKEEMPIKI